MPPPFPAYAEPTVTSKALKGSNRITCGASVKLWSLEGLAEDFGLAVPDIRALVEALGLPLLHLPGSDKRYVNLFALECALFEMTLPDTLKGSKDNSLVRLHQELAGVMYMAATKEAVRERVKRFAQMAGFSPRPGRKKKVTQGG